MGKMQLKTYSNQEVSIATGLTTGACTAFASKAGFSTKNGWTIPQIIELLEGTRRPREGKKIDMERVKELKNALVAIGWNSHAVEGQISIYDEMGVKD